MVKDDDLLHPGKFTFGTQSHGSGWKMEDDFPDFNWVIFRFHVDFQGYRGVGSFKTLGKTFQG